MYSSLTKIDLLVTEPDGRKVAVQTDHRMRAEIEEEPEISILFAMTRVLCARQYLKKEGLGEDVVYVAFDEPPPSLVEALAATEAMIERMPDRARSRPTTSATPGAVAGAAFAGLLARAGRRAGLTEPVAILRALEAETLASPPDREEDEAAYWTRVLELMAAVGAVLNARFAGSWVTTESSDIPFAFSSGRNDQTLAANRAQRFIADGEAESMFLLVAAAEEMHARSAGALERGPIMPSLRSRAEAETNGMLWRAVLDKAESDAAPVVCFGHDGENTISWLMTKSDEPRRAEADAEALRNIAAHDVEVEVVDLDEGKLLSVGGSFFATEKVLDPAFMRGLGRRLDAELLAVGVPRRGFMFVTTVALAPVMIAFIAAQYEEGGSRAISPAVLAVHDGAIVGLIRAGGGGEPDPAPKKPGFFRRLFGR